MCEEIWCLILGLLSVVQAGMMGDQCDWTGRYDDFLFSFLYVMVLYSFFMNNYTYLLTCCLSKITLLRLGVV